MGFAPFDRAPRNVGTGLSAKFAGRKNAKDRPLQNRETPRQFNFSGNKTGCGDAALPCDRATSSNGFVSEDGSDQVGAATMPRNKSQQVSAGRHPCSAAWHERRSSNCESGFCRTFRPAFFFRGAMKPLREKTFYAINRRDAAVEMLRLPAAGSG